MNSMSAFLKGEANRGREMMVFDWEKAAHLIKDRRAKTASAGLANDWEYTGGSILADGLPVPREETHMYLASTWATPELEINGETISCFKMQSETPGWDSGTYWPKSALAILEASPGQAA